MGSPCTDDPDPTDAAPVTARDGAADPDAPPLLPRAEATAGAEAAGGGAAPDMPLGCAGAPEGAGADGRIPLPLSAIAGYLWSGVLAEGSERRGR